MYVGMYVHIFEAKSWLTCFVLVNFIVTFFLIHVLLSVTSSHVM